MLTSCESSDQTILSQAQACLDHANSPSSANVCVAQLGSLRTPDAYLIICSAHFIAQGFTTPRFVSAYNALNTSKSGSNSTASSLAFMAFNSTTGTDGSAQTLIDCQASNVKSLVQLSVLTQMATLVASAAGLAGSYSQTTGYTSAQITAAIASYPTDAASQASLGSTAIAANAAYCAPGSSFLTSSVCTTLTVALGSSTDPATIGAALIAQLKKTQ